MEYTKEIRNGLTSSSPQATRKTSKSTEYEIGIYYEQRKKWKCKSFSFKKA